MYQKVAQFKSPDALRRRLAELRLDLPVDEEILSAAAHSPLARPLTIGGVRVGNRFCIHPMEGWDAEPDGSPSELTLRRWRHFGSSGAKLIWGGEAAAVEPAGRANPRQTLATPENRAGLAALLAALTDAHRARFSTCDDLLVGLQLTHSGRFCRPHSHELEPKIAYHHPILDAKFGIASDDDRAILSDGDVEQLIDQFVRAAGVARDVGFRFVDVKACHGYLLHEFLSARTRPGSYGGDLAGRARFLTEIIARIRAAYPDLLVVTRLSAIDTVPYEPGDGGIGRPAAYDHLLPYSAGFGVDSQNPTRCDLTETIMLLKKLRGLGVVAVNITAGSPYYNPHVQRPAIFPPSDGYLPPEDPLVGVTRHVDVTRRCKEAVSDLTIVGTGYSYLQDYLPHVAQAVVRQEWVDVIGLGRMVLAYPDLPADVLENGTMARKLVCRTFSDCTTAPRAGLVSGCYPLDPHYKELPEAAVLRAAKEGMHKS